MASCPDCGVDLRFGLYKGEKLALDAITTLSGPDRYRYIPETENEIESVAGSHMQPAYPLHKTVCPAQDRLGR